MKDEDSILDNEEEFTASKIEDEIDQEDGIDESDEDDENAIDDEDEDEDENI